MILHAQWRAGRHPQWPCLVWLHGFLGSRHEWLALGETFADWPQLWVDLPGHGESADIAVADFAAVDRLLRATLLHYHITTYWLIGYSLGGRLAMYHAWRQAPAGLRGLVVEGGHPGLTLDSERAARLANDRRWAGRLRQEDFVTVLQDWYRQPVFQTLNADQRAELVAARRQNNPLRLAQMLEATSLARQPDLSALPGALSIPFHYLCGAQDAKFIAVASQLGLTPHLIAAAGHNAHRAAPEAFSRCLLTLLRHHDFKESP